MVVLRLTAMGRTGHTGCEGTSWESETTVRCRVGHGSGRSRLMIITGESRGGSTSQAWSADGSGLSRTRRSNRAGTGAASLTVHGSSMGIVCHTAKGETGHTGCEGTSWESETSVRCTVGHGSGLSRRVAISVRSRGGSTSQAWSADGSGLSLSRRSNRAGTGSASVTVHGSSMGIVCDTVRGRTGHTGCEGTSWESETSVRCRLGHGSRNSRAMVMTLGSRRGSTSQAWSADGSGLSLLLRSNRARTGAASVTVHGSSMGISTIQGRTGHTGCEGTSWVSETSVRCQVSRGTLGTRRVMVTVGSRRGSLSQAWSADMGSISVLHQSNHAVTGAVSVTVHGTGLSFARLTSRARLSRTGGEATDWGSQTSVVCRVGHASKGTRRVVMTVGQGSGSVSQAWSVDVDAISRIRQANRAGSGSASVTVYGAGMGKVRLTAKGQVGHTGCEGTSWESGTSVRCRVGHGSGLSRRVMVTVRSQRGSTSQAWSADGIGLSLRLRSNGAVTGAASVTVHGSSMEILQYTARGRTGRTGCQGTSWESETSVRCHVSHGAFGTRRMVMTVRLDPWCPRAARHLTDVSDSQPVPSHPVCPVRLLAV